MSGTEGNGEKEAADKWVNILKWRVEYYQKLQDTAVYYLILIVGAIIAVPLTGRLVDFQSVLPEPRVWLFWLFSIAFIFIIVCVVIYLWRVRHGILRDIIEADGRKKKLVALLTFILSKKWKTCSNATNEEWLNCVEEAFKDIEGIGINDLDITKFCTRNENKCELSMEKR